VRKARTRVVGIPSKPEHDPQEVGLDPLDPLRIVEVPPESEWDHRWAGVYPTDEGAFLIGDLIEAGITPEHWKSLAVEDRMAVARVVAMTRSLTAARDAVLHDERLDVRASARAFVSEMFGKEKEHRAGNGSFHTTQIRADRLPSAVEYRDRLEPLLAEAKTRAKYVGEDFYERPALIATVKELRTKWDESAFFEPFALETADVAKLRKETPKLVASRVAARAFGVSAEAVKLGYRRSARTSAGGKSR
jgi:hypothetical protein